MPHAHCPLASKLWENVTVGELHGSDMEIGQKVKVRGIIDRIPASIVKKIQKNPVGTIENFKMLDRSEIGLVVKFDEGFSTWFFEEELELIS